MDRFNKIIAPLSMDNLGQDAINIGRPFAKAGRAVGGGISRAAGGIKRMVAGKMKKLPTPGSNQAASIGKKAAGPLINNFISGYDDINKMSQ